eukprot:TRINITY_DN33397_c0_g1_i1.p1 TRINITY_DN33397_c0_g1~~TRINITY_DN33397_c0_g1_i1.p1  ORF type:complete len:576 (-),score=88.29 TRINITY_DN33397_c0_g1_i1:208-1935(-)
MTAAATCRQPLPSWSPRSSPQAQVVSRPSSGFGSPPLAGQGSSITVPAWAAPLKSPRMSAPSIQLALQRAASPAKSPVPDARAVRHSVPAGSSLVPSTRGKADPLANGAAPALQRMPLTARYPQQATSFLSPRGQPSGSPRLVQRPSSPQLSAVPSHQPAAARAASPAAVSLSAASAALQAWMSPRGHVDRSSPRMPAASPGAMPGRSPRSFTAAPCIVAPVSPGPASPQLSAVPSTATVPGGGSMLVSPRDAAPTMKSSPAAYLTARRCTAGQPPSVASLAPQPSPRSDQQLSTGRVHSEVRVPSIQRSREAAAEWRKKVVTAVAVDAKSPQQLLRTPDCADKRRSTPSLEAKATCRNDVRERPAEEERMGIVLPSPSPDSREVLAATDTSIPDKEGAEGRVAAAIAAARDHLEAERAEAERRAKRRQDQERLAAQVKRLVAEVAEASKAVAQAEQAFDAPSNPFEQDRCRPQLGNKVVYNERAHGDNALGCGKQVGQDLSEYQARIQKWLEADTTVDDVKADCGRLTVRTTAGVPEDCDAATCCKMREESTATIQRFSAVDDLQPEATPKNSN